MTWPRSGTFIAIPVATIVLACGICSAGSSKPSIWMPGAVPLPPRMPATCRATASASTVLPPAHGEARDAELLAAAAVAAAPAKRSGERSTMPTAAAMPFNPLRLRRR